MSEDKPIKLFTAAKELNIGTGTIVDFLATKGYKVEKHPMTQLDRDMYSALLKEFAFDKSIKEEAKQISIGKIRKEEPGQIPEKPAENRRSRDFENEEILIKNTGQYNVPHVEKPKPAPVPAPPKHEERSETLPGVKVVGKIDLDDRGAKPEPVEKKEEVVAPVIQEVVAPAPPPEVEKEEVKTPQPPVIEVVKEEIKKEPVTETPKAEATKVVEPASVADEEQEPEVIRAKAERLTGPNVVGKIQLPTVPKRNPIASSSNTNSADHKRKRKRKDSQGGHGGGNQQQG